MTERTRNEIEGDYVVLQERPKRTAAGEWREVTFYGDELATLRRGFESR